MSPTAPFVGWAAADLGWQRLTWADLDGLKDLTRTILSYSHLLVNNKLAEAAVLLTNNYSCSS
jgi:hypothetical protein